MDSAISQKINNCKQQLLRHRISRLSTKQGHPPWQKQSTFHFKLPQDRCSKTNQINSKKHFSDREIVDIHKQFFIHTASVFQTVSDNTVTPHNRQSLKYIWRCSFTALINSSSRRLHLFISPTKSWICKFNCKNSTDFSQSQLKKRFKGVQSIHANRNVIQPVFSYSLLVCN